MNLLSARSARQPLSIDPAEFAPEILRVQSTPPRPMPRAVLGAALALVAATIGWAAAATLDVVAVAPGKLVPHTALKIVQPAEAGIVKEILVSEGQSVQRGQLLMRMDATLSAADLQALATELQQKSIALRRIDAQLQGRPLQAEPGDPPQLLQQAQAQLAANRSALEAAIAQERASWERSRQEMAAAQATKSKLEQTLPHYRQQDEAFRKLVEEGFAGRIMADDKARERIERERDNEAQAFVVAREQANMVLFDRRIAQLKSESIRQLQAERAEITQRLDKLRPELAKQDHRHALLELRAPQDGRIKDLATHTAGTVVQPGTILMTLVPAAESLVAEVWLSNEDVGFVRGGQPAKLKLAAFQFQKYGMLEGSVEQVAADAAAPDQGSAPGPQAMPLAYRTSVALSQQELLADGVRYRLAPGMQVFAEIKLGERTVLEYLLSPIRKAFHEAARER
ncbi:HlyD family type I secretion periplasmic adaptor subunit [Ramlibacter sp.]|uniref:HlyD family type I secretion periplasmic adaptor subunit n=1 Tax=Ramlibacter sp. TaxID=1917967 RepID=UPI002B982616|nr:HlyD family type I secretion periplasmic adaptor subunit [Ramlibacter sp.]HWI80420.1 HlyD family type I secretion periplasmic adaptor subunit [Ramlibacter sp.]